MSTTDESGQVHIEARLNTSVILRYRTVLKRDFCHAIAMLSMDRH